MSERESGTRAGSPVRPARAVMRLAGILTVARLEFRLRIRAGRWRWLVAAWFLVLLAVTALVRAAASQQNIAGDEAGRSGAVMFGVVVLIVLALALLVAPALAAQSVNGDRERGTLATLQVTRLRAGEIAVGKLLASWGTALVFLAVTLPLALWCYVEGGLSVLRIAGVYLVTALLLGVVCAISLALSALLARSTTSGVLAYLTVFALTVGTLIAFGLLTAVTQETVQANEQVCEDYVGGSESSRRPASTAGRSSTRPRSPGWTAPGGCSRPTRSPCWPTRRRRDPSAGSGCRTGGSSRSRWRSTCSARCPAGCTRCGSGPPRSRTRTGRRTRCRAGSPAARCGRPVWRSTCCSPPARCG